MFNQISGSEVQITVGHLFHSMSLLSLPFDFLFFLTVILLFLLQVNRKEQEQKENCPWKVHLTGYIHHQPNS